MQNLTNNDGELLTLSISNTTNTTQSTNSSQRIMRQPPSSNNNSQITPPYPWATSHRAQIHTLQYLVSNGLTTIRGEVHCKRCEKNFEMEYDLRDKFQQVAHYLLNNKGVMHDRAPAIWLNPTLPDCKFCEQKHCVKPVMSKKKSINWLFLLLGQMLGCCKLDELKYFCKHTKNHRTGAKDRVLYLTYLGLCKQLDPAGPFDR